MSTFILILLGISIGILGYGLVSTMMLTKQKAQNSGNDGSIPDEVKKRPYLRNPIFLTYMIAAAITIILIAYYAFSLNW
ncbi:hypothetical protein [Bacillus mesophilum]|uniref:Uncharacterized protein n=1 Tax=Bacillus mesophilum TaxID=1071718 RepID=A0A7V7V0M8_9BACI|nr:hypothetical protein [Bacillus mesophilum]KAB2335237.1 hypothetical protein F7732_01325 [Bacillus mesophilum]